MAKVSTKSSSKKESVPELKTEMTPVVAPTPVVVESVGPKETKKKVVKTVKVEETPKVEVKTETTTPAVTVETSTTTTATTTPVVEESATTTTEDNGVEALFNKLVNQFQDLQVVMKTLHTNIKVLQKEVMKERKEHAKKAEKASKKTKGTRKPSGIAVPEAISTEVADFLGVPHDTKLSRIQVTSKIFDYVKSNNLQNPASRKEIIPDAKLGALLLNGDKTVFFFNIQTFLKRHFPSAASSTTATSTAPEAVV
jgi:upstream activation factor subunit UAF30